MTKHEAEKWLEGHIAFIQNVDKNFIILIIDGVQYCVPVVWNQPDLRSIA
jgi:hypothetical protein